LAAGIVYGAYHTSQLKSAAHKAEEQKAFDAKLALIAEAKAEYAKLHKKPEEPKPVSNTKEINLDDKELDFAQVILSAVENLKN
jgi:F-type H+-transporting ATP synthase subunit e